MNNKVLINKFFGVKQIIGLLISILCVYLIIRQVDTNELAKAIKNLDWYYVVLGIVSLGLGYTIRVYRWAVMLRASGVDVSTLSCAAPFLGSIAMNNVLPLRAGDLVRAFVFPTKIGVRKVTATASLLLERLIDLLTLLISMSIGFMFSNLIHIPPLLEDSLVSLSIFAGAALFSVIIFHGMIKNFLIYIKNRLSQYQFSHGRFGYIFNSAIHLLEDLGVMSRINVLVPVLFLSMMVWLGESGLFLAILMGLNIQANIAIAMLIMSISTLSTLVPSSPGYVGPFHLAAFTAVTMLGGDSSQAASFAIIVHLALWLPTTIIGGIAILLNPNMFKLKSSHN